MNNIKFEILKLVRRKDTKVLMCALLTYYIGMIVLTIVAPSYFGSKFMLENSFSTLQFIPIVLIILSSDLISSEYQLGTIKSLIISSRSRLIIFISKIITFFVTLLIFFSLIGLLDFVVGNIFFKKQFDYSVEKAMDLWILGSIVEMLMLGALVFLLSIVSKNAAIPVSVGVLMYLLAGLVDGMNFNLISKMNFLKWNPINLLNFKAQLIDATMQKHTHLSLSSLILGILCYSILFFATSCILFQQKDF